MKRHDLLNQIKEAQKEKGFVSEAVIQDMAKAIGISISDVYGVTTFYSFLSTQPQGRHTVRICKSVPCLLQNGETVSAAIEKDLGIAPGETTSDGRFTFELTNCIGACDQAPAMLVDDAIYGNLTPERIKTILQSHD
ncbi:MAG: NADH-quinone oxidoreductase subunit NuoE [Deltaproteobacteria bacterium]|nr:NADH-quinone oxidoreductase subunit NuoE [Deltaproteobacteria bacterium]